MHEKIKAQIENLFASANSNKACAEVSGTDIQRQVNNDVLAFSFFYDWPFAPTIPLISALASVYGKEPKEIIIYGAGPVALDALNDLRLCGLSAAFFCDRNPQKHNTLLRGIPVISPEELAKNHLDAYIVISAIRYMFNIFYQLRGMGFNADNIFIPPYEGGGNANFFDE